MNKLQFLLFFVLVILMTGCTSSKKEENIDHIILAINNLEKGVAQFKELTGIEPVFGGVHPYSFTHNALVALDSETYIEIMAPRPDAKDVPEEFTKIENLTPIGWAVRTRNIYRTKEKLKAAGFTLTENKAGSRTKPDGTVLKWTTFGVDEKEAFPFFIQWGDSTIHPSATSPAGCTFKSLKVTSSDSKSFRQLNDQLKLGLIVNEGTDAAIEIAIQTPKGLVTFSSEEKKK